MPVTPSELTPTALTILGFLSLEPRSGYDLKHAADRSTRLFWGISYGQIYPQLRNLEELRLITPVERRADGRRRVYRITAAGRRVLASWLAEPVEAPTYRDEALLKLMFGDAMGTDDALTLVRERRKLMSEFRNFLADAVPGAHSDSARRTAVFPFFVHDFGVSFCDAMVEWCDRTERSLLAARRSRRSDSA